MTITEDVEVCDTDGFFKRLALQRYSTSAASSSMRLTAGRFNDIWLVEVDDDVVLMLHEVASVYSVRLQFEIGSLTRFFEYTVFL